MRFLLKLIMKLHSKIWYWFDHWGEPIAIAQASHFANAFCNAMDNPRTLLPFLFGSFVGRQTMKSKGDSWVPLLWKLAIACFFVIAIMDVVISLFAFCYDFVACILTYILLALGLWEQIGKAGLIKISYIRNIWLEVAAEHEVYIMQNVAAAVECMD